jgi:hypothetical protein
MLEYESVAGIILDLVAKRGTVRVHPRYLPDVLALLSRGEICIIDNSSAKNPIIVGRA